MRLQAKHTVRAGFVGYLTQAITINFAPLLFLTFEKEFDISLGKISLLIAISFIAQFLTDAITAKFDRSLNTRALAIAAHVLAILGMTGFAWLPDLLPAPYVGLILCTVLCAIGGGLTEVLISPIIEACPTDPKKKSATMSLLHSFYCWGVAAITLFSTLFFALIGIEHWRLLSCLWAIVPALGVVAFSLVPIYDLPRTQDTKTPTRKERSLFRSGLFWLLFIIMFCGGAAEQVMLQWSSAFAESGLGVSKAVGDLLGPFAFAIFMGTARIVYALMSERIKLARFITLSAALCVISYLLASLSPSPLLSLLACTLCGLAVGITWPGTLSLGAKNIPFGGVRMFALLAMAGDLGCMVGPTVIGWIAELLGNDLKAAFLVAALFPALIVLLSPMVEYANRKKRKKNASPVEQSQKG